MRAAWLVVVPLALAGCFDSRTSTDGGAVADAGLDGASMPLDASMMLDASMPLDASLDALVPRDAGACHDDVDCDDGQFCNGPERCLGVGPARRCAPGAVPCARECDEATDRCCVDRDGDGQVELGCGGGQDCDDDDPEIHPGAWELCGGADQDCDPATFGADGDEDDDGHARPACCQVLADGARTCGDDCDDAWVHAYPGADEMCDLRDDDCDGAIDEGMPLADRPVLADCDGDGYGSPEHGVIACWPSGVRGPLACPHASYSYESEVDCDDDRYEARPESTESFCDGVDDDCDGVVDRTLRDDDGDGFPRFACDGTMDCDDGSATVHPGAPELCDQRDTDCDPATPREDADYDGHLAPDATCVGDGFPRDDCDDTRNSVHPARTEVCNGIDDDCDGTIDGTGAWCRRDAATATECRDARCIDVACRAGVDRCVDPERCDTDVANDDGHCGTCGTRCASSACVAGECERFVDLAIAGDRTLGLTVSGSALGITSSGAWGATGDPSSRAARAVADGTRTCVAYVDGQVVCPGVTLGALALPGVVELGSGHGFQCVRLVGGGVRCWGNGTAGQLGNGVVYHEVSVPPVAVLGVDDAIGIAVAGRSACALRSGGEIRCWGSGAEGTLGNGTTDLAPTPVPVATTLGGIAIAAGLDHMCSLDAAGSIWCWGSNARGQLGVASVGARALTPQRVALDDAVAIAAGGSSTCAITRAGALWCWGANDAGQLGDGTRLDHDAPVLVDLGVHRVAVGAAHGCLARAGGDVACWGENTDGRLGDGTREDALRPTPLDWTP